MAYVPPALRKRTQASSPGGTLGTTAEAAGSDENLPPGMAPRRSAAGPVCTQVDIHNHYWDPRNEGKGPAHSSWTTLSASAEEPDKIKYIVLFRDANPRWQSHGVIFVKSKLHILPGGERFKSEQLDEAGAISVKDPVKREGVKRVGTHESEPSTGDTGGFTNEVPREKVLVKESQVSDESQASAGEHLAKDKQEHGEKAEPPEEIGKKQDFTKAHRNPDPDPEPPYSPDLSLHPTSPIAVFEQAHGGPVHGASARFRFAGYHKIVSLEYLPPHSRELYQLLEQKWTMTDRRGRVRQKERSAESWKGSLNHRWAVIQMEKDQDANDRLDPPKIEARDRAAEASSGKSVNELLAEMRLKG